MAYNLHKRTKINLADSTGTTNNDSTNPNNIDNNNNNNSDNEIASVIIKGKAKDKLVDIDVANSEENKCKESNSNKKGKKKMEDDNIRESDDNDNMKNIEQQQQPPNVEQRQVQQQQGVDVFSGDIIMHQLLQATHLFFHLDLPSVLSLALTSKTLFKPLSSLISQHFTFHCKHTPLIHYHPKKLKIDTFDIDGLFDNPCLSNVAEIEFTTPFNHHLPSFTTNHPFDKAITNLLSLNFLTKLTIGSYFNQRINSLVHLTKLTHLHFNHEFTQAIDHLLPPNLTHLFLGGSFKKTVNHLPLNLTHLHFHKKFNQPINQLPLNLVYLKLGEYFTHPLNLLYLTKLTHLEFDPNNEFNSSIDNVLPPSLTNLLMGFRFNHRINQLPANLTHLRLSDHFNQKIDSFLHLTKLTYLKFLTYFDQPIDGLLPPNLNTLILGWSYNKSIDNLPESITHLELGHEFKTPINHLPPNITHLILPNYTPLQYEYIQKMPSLLFFNNKPIKPNNSDERGSSSVSENENATQINW